MAIEVGQTLAQRGKVAAMHHLRRTTLRLTRTQAQTYVSALQVQAITGPNPP
jgi:hypothetical protein